MKRKKNKWWLVAILSFALVTRLWRVGEPAEYYFDEVYHAFTARYYAANDPRGYEWWHKSPQEGTAFEWLHPPVAKLLQGFSIYMLGDTSWAWRLPSVVFGVLTVAGVYWLGKELSKKEEVGLVAAAAASLDGLLLTQSRIAMNDMVVVFFTVMALGSYWKFYEEKGKKAVKWLAVAALMTGLAVSSKWSGVFVVGVVGVWEGWRWVKSGFSGQWGRWVKLVIAFGVMPAVIYVLSFGQWWLQGHTLEQFKELHKQIWWYQTNLEATHPYQSRPWEWVLNIKPVWYHVDYSEGKVANIYNTANPVITVSGVVALVWVLVRRGKKELVWWFVGLSYLLMWVEWTLSPRIMFFYHYAPAIPWLCVVWGRVWMDWWKDKNREMRMVAVAVAVMAVGFFGYYFPYWTGMKLPQDWGKYYEWSLGWRE